MAVMLAALLHDADDRKFFGPSDDMGHARRIASEALRGEGPWDGVADMSETVVKLISLVSASKNKNDAGSNVERWMLFPRLADRLEAIGWIGVVRCYQYNSHCKAPLYLPSTPRVTNEAELAAVAPPERFARYNGESASMIDHYYDKLVHVARLESDNPFFHREALARRKVMLDFLFDFGRTGTVDTSRFD